MTEKVIAYLGGSSGIETPLDFIGNEIKVGDNLSWDMHDKFTTENGGIKDWMNKPIFNVKKMESGFFAEGINEDLYLHDFRFKYCEIMK